MTPQYILKASLCREPNCASESNWKRTAESEIENLDWASDYAEPGYTAGPKGILTANWNYFPSNIDQILERAGYSTEWSDEWTTCDDCGKLVRTSPDGYSWQRSFVMMNECETVCLDCVDWAEYLKSIEDASSHAVMRACDPSKYGYTRISEPAEYEHGFHPGQNDDPKTILASLHEQDKYNIVFRIPETSQFYITFEVWQRTNVE